MEISIFLFHRLDSTIPRSIGAIMVVQSQSYDFPVPRFLQEFFENYVTPMGREGGNRDGERNAGLFAERNDFWTSVEREQTRVTLGQSSPSHLYDDITLPRGTKGGNEQSSR